MNTLITGGSGFIGTHLSRACLEAGHEVTALGTRARHDRIDHPRFHYMAADTTRAGDWQHHVPGADRIFNLAGCNIFQRWSRQYKQQLYESRILTTRNVVDAMTANTAATLISTSAVGYYGSCGNTELTEESPEGKDFLAVLAKDWEAAAKKAETKGARVVIARLGIVLGADGGALAKMAPAFRFFVGGPLGDGRHWFPWIHLRDMLKSLDFLARRSQLRGPFNICAPHPISNGEMAHALGKVLGRPARMALPAPVLRIMMGELAGVLLSSQRTLPARLLSAGYEFDFPQIDAALTDLLKA